MRKSNKWARILKTFLKASLTWHFEGKKPPIFLFATPRGGSTWISEVICRQPGMRYIAEPLNIRAYGVKEALGVSSWEQMLDLKSHALINYLERLVSGKIRMRDATPLRHIGRYGFRFKTNRTLLKTIHGATYQLPAIRAQLGAKIVVVIRHPIATALSREVFPALDRVQHSQLYDSLSSEKQTCINNVLEEGNHLKKGVLAWCLHNEPFFRSGEDSNFLVSYEELTMCPEVAVQELCDYCDLDLVDEILDSLSFASVTTRKSDPETQALLNKSDGQHSRSKKLIEKWRAKVNPKEEDDAMRILQVFELDAYEAGSFLPKDKYIYNPDRIKTIL